MREENLREKKNAKALKFADQKAFWGTSSKHMCVTFIFHVYMRFEGRLTKGMEILSDRFNGKNLRGYAIVRATKRSILIFHFTIYIISNILFFLPFYLNIIFLIFLYFSFIFLSFSSSLSLSYLKVCLIGIISKILSLSLI